MRDSNRIDVRPRIFFEKLDKVPAQIRLARKNLIYISCCPAGNEHPGFFQYGLKKWYKILLMLAYGHVRINAAVLRMCRDLRSDSVARIVNEKPAPLEAACGSLMGSAPKSPDASITETPDSSAELSMASTLIEGNTTQI